MAPSDSRSVNRYGHGHSLCKFPINVTVPPNPTSRYLKCRGGKLTGRPQRRTRYTPPDLLHRGAEDGVTPTCVVPS